MADPVDFSGPKRWFLRVLFTKIRRNPMISSVMASALGFVLLTFADRIAVVGCKISLVARQGSPDEIGFLLQVIGYLVAIAGLGYLSLRLYWLIGGLFVRLVYKKRVAELQRILKEAVDDPGAMGLMSAGFIYRGLLIFYASETEARKQVDEETRAGRRVNVQVEDIIEAHRQTAYRMNNDIQVAHYRHGSLEQGEVIRMILDFEHGGIFYYNCYADLYVMGGVIEQHKMESTDCRLPVSYRQMEKLVNQIRKHFGLTAIYPE